MQQGRREAAIYVGVDTHGDTNVAVAVDDGGTEVAHASLPTNRRGCAEMLAWARSLGEVARFGVECTGTYGAGLLRHLSRERVEVVEVTSPDRSVRRRRGKDDLVDAAMAAEAARTGARCVTPKSRDGMVESLRVLTRARASAVKARKAAIEQIRSLLVSAPDAVRDQFRGMGTSRLVGRLAASRPDSSGWRDPAVATRVALKSLAGRYQDLDDEVGELDAAIKSILEEVAPLLLEERCVGPQVAAQLMITAGDNPERLRSESSFAMLCGVAPRPASSGLTTRHRLNRGGDRAANSALHIVAVGRLRVDERTRAYVARKMSEGHSKLEAIRCVKRYIARELYYDIVAQNRMLKTT